MKLCSISFFIPFSKRISYNRKINTIVFRYQMCWKACLLKTYGSLIFKQFIFTKSLQDLYSLHKWFPHLSQQISANSFLLAKIAHSNMSEMVDVSVSSVIFNKFDIQKCPFKTH